MILFLSVRFDICCVNILSYHLWWFLEVVQTSSLASVHSYLTIGGSSTPSSTTYHGYQRPNPNSNPSSLGIVIRENMSKEHISTSNHIGENILTQNLMGELYIYKLISSNRISKYAGRTSWPWDHIGELNLNLEPHRVISTHLIFYWSSHRWPIKIMW